MFGSSVGGNDTATGGLNSWNEFYGDAAEYMGDSARGGADVLTGGNTYADGSDPVVYSEVSTVNTMYGDAYQIDFKAKGGADTIKGGTVQAGSYASANGSFSATGDAFVMSGAAVGGADRITGSHAVAAEFGDAYVTNVLIGDAYVMSGGGIRADDAPMIVTAGADTITGGNASAEGDGYAVAINLMMGDAYSANTGVKFAGDTLVGGSGSHDAYAINVMVGDALLGDGGLGGPPMFGDLGSMLSGGAAGILGALDSFATMELPEAGIADDSAMVYANDTIRGGNMAINLAVGDTLILDFGDKGGNDTIQGGTGESLNILVGDAYAMYFGAEAGRDKIISGAGSDIMIGDAYIVGGGPDIDIGISFGAADTFVFRSGNGNDVILDFQAGQDKIDLTAFKAMPFFRNFDGFANRMEDVGDGVLLHLDARNPNSDSNTVLLVGVEIEDLTAASFIFA
jgi:hypothetical protein